MKKQVAIIGVLTLLLTLSTMGSAKAQTKSIDELIIAGAELLDSNADWTNVAEGRKIYDQLQAKDGKQVTEGLVKAVLANKNRLKVLFLGVKLGINGSQETLNGVLMDHGDKSMAEDFLNSGSHDLYEGGKRWANAHGYSINTGMGSHRIGWGRF